MTASGTEPNNAIFSRRTWTFAAAGVVALHIAKVAWWLRHVTWRSGFPLLNAEYGRVYAQLLRVHEFLSRTGRCWGFDPYQKAGSAAGLGIDLGSYITALLSHAASRWISLGHALLILEIAGLLAAPAALALAVYGFSRSRLAGWTSFMVLMLMFGCFDPPTRTAVFTGQWGYLMASFFAFLQVVAFWRWLDDRTWLNWSGLFLVSAVLFQIHPLVFMVVLVPDGLLVAAWRRMPARAYVALFVTTAAVVAANRYWVRPFVSFAPWRTDFSLFPTHGALSLFSVLNPIQASWDGSVRAVLCGVCFAAAAATVWRQPARPRIFFLIWLGTLAVIASYGSHIPLIRSYQPGLVIIPIHLLIYGLASLEICRVLRRRADLHPVAIGLTLLALVFVFRDQAALINEVPPFEQPLMTYVTRNAPIDGRVMIETLDDAAPHLVDYLGLAARQSLVELPPLADMTETQFAERLALNNVSLVAASSPSALKILAGFDGTLEALGPLGRYVCFRVRRPAGWFLKGHGSVAFDFDRVTLNEPSAGPVVLKLHWLPTFRAEPSVSMKGVSVGDDPMPFVALNIPEGARRVTISN